jgi:Uma2 family endonuclease
VPRCSTPRSRAATPDGGDLRHPGGWSRSPSRSYQRPLRFEVVASETPIRLMTAQELLEYRHEPYQQELVDGIRFEMEPPGAEHSVVAMNIGYDLTRHVRDAGLGIAGAAEAGFLLTSDPDTVRAPDVFFIARERLPAAGIPKGYWPGPPDLAVEVVSPNDRRKEVEAKALEWLAAGARAVVVIDPPTRTATVLRGPDAVAVLYPDDRLDLDDVVPGWSPRVGDFFAF